MVSHEKVAYEFTCGRRASGNSMFTRDNVIFSWGAHFPIAARIRGIVLFNIDKYSSSTSKHQSIVRSACRNSTFSNNIYECSTEEIKRAIENPEEPIIITKKVIPTSIDESLTHLRTIMKMKGMKRFPARKIREFLMSEMV